VLVADLLEDVDRFTEGAPPADDVTVLIAKMR
jgi:hypothetical protein